MPSAGLDIGHMALQRLLGAFKAMAASSPPQLTGVKQGLRGQQPNPVRLPSSVSGRLPRGGTHGRSSASATFV